MSSLIYCVLAGLLVRAEGWGTKDPRWKHVADFFDVVSCSILFSILTYIFGYDLLISLAAGAAFFIFRAPGFRGWEKWLPMFWRGLWTSAIGFTILSYVVNGNLLGGLLAIPMGAAMAICYSGTYKWLPGRIPQWMVHPVAEITSGVFLGMFAIVIMQYL